MDDVWVSRSSIFFYLIVACRYVTQEEYIDKADTETKEARHEDQSDFRHLLQQKKGFFYTPRQCY